MRKYFLSSLLLLAFYLAPIHALRAQAPIPNGDFEQWSGGKPVGWTVDDTTLSGQSFMPITQTSDAHGGASAMMESVVGIMFGGTTVAQILPIAISGTISGNDTGGFAYTDRPNSITGFYKFSPVGSDSVSIVVAFKKKGTGIGGGGGYILTAAQSYTSFALPIYWSSNDSPDTSYISIIIPAYSGTANAGTSFEIDDLAFSNQSASAVASAATSSFNLDQNYPNPLSGDGSTTIAYSLDEPGYASLEVYDLDGRVVATPVDETLPAGNHIVNLDCSRWPSGVYSYRLISGSRSLAKTMQVFH